LASAVVNFATVSQNVKILHQPQEFTVCSQNNPHSLGKRREGEEERRERKREERKKRIEEEERRGEDRGDRK
jgi:hypothetical protein